MDAENLGKPVSKRGGARPNSGGSRAGAGRPKGVPNKLTRTVKEAIEQAFHGVGGAQYLMEQAQQNPQAFMTLLGKIIPAQVQQEVTNPDGSLKPQVIQIVGVKPEQ